MLLLRFSRRGQLEMKFLNKLESEKLILTNSTELRRLKPAKVGSFRTQWKSKFNFKTSKDSQVTRQ